jgi:hypothetical protein
MERDYSSGECRTQKVDDQLSVNVMRKPGENRWRIKSYDLSWLSNLVLNNARVHAERLGWTDRTFSTPDDAKSFVIGRINAGVPRLAS